MVLLRNTKQDDKSKTEKKERTKVEKREKGEDVDNDVADMEVSLNPHVEKNWRRLLINVLLEVDRKPNQDTGISAASTGKTLSKAALKQLEADARIMEKARFVEWKTQVLAANDETTADFKKYEKLTVSVLQEMCELKNITALDANGKPANRKHTLLMALLKANPVKSSASSSSSGSK